MKQTFASLLALLLLAGSLHAQKPPAVVYPEPPPHTRTEDVVYGRKFGVALTLDVLQPEKSNGYGIVYMVSGGWVSSHAGVSAKLYAPYLEHGYTVFAVCHGCQPKFIIPEITQDIHRAIRFIRANAKKWNVNPDKLGISGGSAGGHLSLTMGVHGAPGDPQAKDPIDRESSAIQAIACLYPPTDFLNYGKPGEDAVGVGTLKNYRGAFGTESDTPEGRQRLGKEVSPIYFVTPKLPPTLIIHGDADTLVPIQQSQTFLEKATAAGVVNKLVVKPGAGHGWPDRTPDYELMASWFDEHLRGVKK